MKKKLYLGTVVFPYGNDERSFIEPEIEYLVKTFEVTIISCPSDENYNNYKEQEKLFPNMKFIRYKAKDTVKDVIKYSFGALCSKMFWNEIWAIQKEKNNSVKKIISALKFYIRACEYKAFLKRIIRKEEKATYYSFWNNDLCLGALMLKNENSGLKVVSRLHGHDLYNERQACGRQAYKKYMDDNLDEILFICKFGMEYYLNHFSNSVNAYKYHICPLGAPSVQVGIVQKDIQFMRVVSCSRAIELKRIDLIIEALSQIDDIHIEWIHFGDGEMYDELCALANHKLSNKENIVYKMPGMVENTKVKEFYRTNYVDCFISMSESEGSPVSIQEAMLYEIPIIARNVGGISEMVNENGILLNQIADGGDLAEAICRLNNMNEQEIKEMRSFSRKKWNEMYNIEINGEILVNYLL